MKSRKQILKTFFKKEITQVLRDKRMRILLFVAPLLQLMIFGLAISNETRNVKIAIFAKPNDILIQDIYRRALGTNWFIPAQVDGNDPFAWVQSGQADAVLVAPPEGSYRSLGENRAKVQLLINATNSLRAQSVEAYVKIVGGQVESTRIQAPEGHGIHFEVRSLFNPTFETSLFMVPGVLSMLVCLITILLTSMAVAREKEIGTIETLLASPIDRWDLLLGKTTPFVALGCVQAPLILIFAVLAFGLPVRGPLILLALSTLLMVCTTVGIGLLISTLAKTQQQAMLGGFLFLFPAVLLSGMMFPIENMPAYMKPLAYINPLTHFIDLLRNILLVGGNLDFFWIHAGALLAIGVVVVSIALSRFKSTVN